MTSVKKPCINSSKHFYTGTELSPLHYGLSAEGYEINSVMEGFDKELWVVDIKNNKKSVFLCVLSMEARYSFIYIYACFPFDDGLKVRLLIFTIT